MPELGKYEETVRAINTRIDDAQWQQVRYDESAEWFGKMLGDIALAVGVQEVVYVDSKLTENEDRSFSAGVLVFTPTTIVECKADGKQEGFQWSVNVETVARKRHGLASLSAASNRSLFSKESFTDWPGTVRFRAEYESGYSFALPTGFLNGDRARQELLDLFESLRSELSAP
jgi:hypothetical protein